MGKPPQACLQATDHDRKPREGLSGQIGVHDHGVVRPQAFPASGRVGVLASSLTGGRIVGYHAVQVPRPDEHAVPRPSQFLEGARVLPSGLGQHGDPVAGRFQHAADHGGAEARMVHVGVSRHHEKVVVPPVPVDHILF